jgi:murein DD-endopeptidase MepM/ murein hydrolase activator NlpD
MPLGFLLFAAFLSVVLVTQTPLRHFAIALVKHVEGAYVAYRLTSERDALVAANLRLQEEVESLRQASKGGEFETKVLTQLEELQGIIEGATELDLDRGTNMAVPRKGPKGHDALASILNNPSLNKKQNKAPKNDSKGEGEQASKQNISFAPTRFSKEGGVLNPFEQSDHGIRGEVLQKAQRLEWALRYLPLGYPVEGEVTSGFGHRQSPFSHSSSFHEGLDISLSKGGDVLVTGAGMVTKSEYDGAYGWVVDVTHSPGIVTRYAHLSKPLVKVGQLVERGDKIALSGNTGRSTGPHLHYEVRVNDRPRNPQSFVMLPQRLSQNF